MMASYKQIRGEFNVAKDYSRRGGTHTGRFPLQPAVSQEVRRTVGVERLSEALEENSVSKGVHNVSRGEIKFVNMGPETLASVLIIEEALASEPGATQQLVGAPALVDVPAIPMSAVGISNATMKATTDMTETTDIENQDFADAIEGTTPSVPSIKEDTILTESEYRSTKATGVRSRTLKELLLEFHSLRQGSDECVSTFAIRVERLAMGIAKIHFESGLKESIQRLVKVVNIETFYKCWNLAVQLEELEEKTMLNSAEQPKWDTGQHSASNKRIPESQSSFEEAKKRDDALTGAEDLDSSNGEIDFEERTVTTQKDQQRRQTPSKICFNCGEEGHTAAECQVSLGNQYGNEEMQPNSQQSDTKSQKKCRYCRRDGHNYENCRRLKRKLGILGSAEPEIIPRKNKVNIIDDNSAKPNFKIFGKRRQPNRRSRDVHQVMTYATQCDSDDTVSHLEHTRSARRVIRATRQDYQRNHILLEAETLKSRTTFLVDSGAAVSVIKIGKLRNKIPLIQNTVILHGIADQGILTLGKVVIYFQFGHEQLGHVFHVVSNDFHCSGGILGEDFLESIDLDVRIIPGKALSINGSELRFHPLEGTSQLEFSTKSGDRAIVQTLITPKEGEIQTRQANVFGSEAFRNNIHSVVSRGGIEKSPPQLSARKEKWNENFPTHKRYLRSIHNVRPLNNRNIFPREGGKVGVEKEKSADLERIQANVPRVLKFPWPGHLWNANHPDESKGGFLHWDTSEIGVSYSESRDRYDFWKLRRNEVIIGDSFSLPTSSEIVTQLERKRNCLKKKLDSWMFLILIKKEAERESTSKLDKIFETLQQTLGHEMAVCKSHQQIENFVVTRSRTLLMMIDTGQMQGISLGPRLWISGGYENYRLMTLGFYYSSGNPLKLWVSQTRIICVIIWTTLAMDKDIPEHWDEYFCQTDQQNVDSENFHLNKKDSQVDEHGVDYENLRWNEEDSQRGGKSCSVSVGNDRMTATSYEREPSTLFLQPKLSNKGRETSSRSEWTSEKIQQNYDINTVTLEVISGLKIFKRRHSGLDHNLMISHGPLEGILNAKDEGLCAVNFLRISEHHEYELMFKENDSGVMNLDAMHRKNVKLQNQQGDETITGVRPTSDTRVEVIPLIDVRCLTILNFSMYNAEKITSTSECNQRSITASDRNYSSIPDEGINSSHCSETLHLLREILHVSIESTCSAYCHVTDQGFTEALMNPLIPTFLCFIFSNSEYEQLNVPPSGNQVTISDRGLYQSGRKYSFETPGMKLQEIPCTISKILGGRIFDITQTKQESMHTKEVPNEVFSKILFQLELKQVDKSKMLKPEFFGDEKVSQREKITGTPVHENPCKIYLPISKFFNGLEGEWQNTRGSNELQGTSRMEKNSPSKSIHRSFMTSICYSPDGKRIALFLLGSQSILTGKDRNGLPVSAGNSGGCDAGIQMLTSIGNHDTFVWGITHVYKKLSVTIRRQEKMPLSPGEHEIRRQQRQYRKLSVAEEVAAQYFNRLHHRKSIKWALATVRETDHSYLMRIRYGQRRESPEGNQQDFTQKSFRRPYVKEPQQWPQDNIQNNIEKRSVNEEKGQKSDDVPLLIVILTTERRLPVIIYKFKEILIQIIITEAVVHDQGVWSPHYTLKCSIIWGKTVDWYQETMKTKEVTGGTDTTGILFQLKIRKDETGKAGIELHHRPNTEQQTNVERRTESRMLTHAFFTAQVDASHIRDKDEEEVEESTIKIISYKKSSFNIRKKLFNFYKLLIHHRTDWNQNLSKSLDRKDVEGPGLKRSSHLGLQDYLFLNLFLQLKIQLESSDSQILFTEVITDGKTGSLPNKLATELTSLFHGRHRNVTGPTRRVHKELLQTLNPHGQVELKRLVYHSRLAEKNLKLNKWEPLSKREMGIKRQVAKRLTVIQFGERQSSLRQCGQQYIFTMGILVNGATRPDNTLGFTIWIRECTCLVVIENGDTETGTLDWYIVRHCLPSLQKERFPSTDGDNPGDERRPRAATGDEMNERERTVLGERLSLISGGIIEGLTPFDSLREQFERSPQREHILTTLVIFTRTTLLITPVPNERKRRSEKNRWYEGKFFAIMRNQQHQNTGEPDLQSFSTNPQNPTIRRIKHPVQVKNDGVKNQGGSSQAAMIFLHRGRKSKLFSRNLKNKWKIFDKEGGFNLNAKAHEEKSTNWVDSSVHDCLISRNKLTTHAKQGKKGVNYHLHVTTLVFDLSNQQRTRQGQRRRNNANGETRDADSVTRNYIIFIISFRIILQLNRKLFLG